MSTPQTPSSRSTRLTKSWDITWELLQIIILLLLSGILFINPVGSIKSLISLVGFFFLLISIVSLVQGLRKGNIGYTLAAIFDGLLGLFLVLNALLSLKLFSIIIGLLIIFAAVIRLLFLSAVGMFKPPATEATGVIDHERPHAKPARLSRVQWQKISSLLLVMIGLVFVVFPTLGSITISYFMGAVLCFSAVGKINNLVK